MNTSVSTLVCSGIEVLSSTNFIRNTCMTVALNIHMYLTCADQEHLDECISKKKIHAQHSMSHITL